MTIPGETGVTTTTVAARAVSTGSVGITWATGTLVHITTTGAIAGKTRVTRTAVAARGVGTGGVGVTGINTSTFIHIGTTGATARVTLITRTRETANGVGATGIGITVIGTLHAFIHILGNTTVALASISVTLCRGAKSRRAV